MIPYSDLNMKKNINPLNLTMYNIKSEDHENNSKQIDDNKNLNYLRVKSYVDIC